MPIVSLSPAAQAFDAVAETFDERYGNWLSVAAQRRTVRAQLLSAFPPGARLLELGGGTGEDALCLARHGRDVLLTDASQAMVEESRRKMAGESMARAVVASAEALDTLADDCMAVGDGPFDGAFSNFAALNCVPDLDPVARGLARLLRPGAPAILVIFGPFAPGEIITQLVRGGRAAAFRRLARGEVSARLGGREFTVRYHRPRQIARAMTPWFRLVRRRGIGIFVPPSAAEPWISNHVRMLRVLDVLDRAASGPFWYLGDHVLYHFERTTASAPRAATP